VAADERSDRYDWAGFAAGAAASFSVAGAIMAASFVGFGALLKGLEFDLSLGLLTVVIVWALPGQVVLVDSLNSGAGLIATAFAVSLTAVRLMPLTVLVLSQSRLARAPRWPEYLVAHFTAVTMWLLSVQKLESVTYRQRMPWLIGLGSTLSLAMLGFTTLGYELASRLPLPIAAALAFVTPTFFLLSLLSGARWRFDYAAILLGSVLGPVVFYISPQHDLTIAGLLGGTLAYFAAPPVPRRPGG
jgi:predicted branched-subunit amino acid permease